MFHVKPKLPSGESCGCAVCGHTSGRVTSPPFGSALTPIRRVTGTPGCRAGAPPRTAPSWPSRARIHTAPGRLRHSRWSGRLVSSRIGVRDPASGSRHAACSRRSQVAPSAGHPPSVGSCPVRSDQSAPTFHRSARSETGHRMHSGNAVVTWAAMSMNSVHGGVRDQAKRETRLAEPGKKGSVFLVWRLADKTTIVLA